MTLKPLLAILLAVSLPAASLPARAQPVPLTPDARARMEAEDCADMTAYPSCAIGRATESGRLFGRGVVCGVRKAAPGEFFLPLALVYVLAHDKADFDRALEAYRTASSAGAAEQLDPRTAMPCKPLLALVDSWRMRAPAR